MKNLVRVLSFVFLLPLSAFAGVDLVLNHTDAPFDPIAAGGTVTYSLSVENDGDITATGVTTIHSVPAGFTVTSLPAGCSDIAGTIPVILMDRLLTMEMWPLAILQE